MAQSISSEQMSVNNLMAILDETPVAELMLWVRTNCVTEDNQDQMQIRRRQAMASAFAITKVKHYLVAMRALDERRTNLNTEIHQLLASEPPLHSDNIDAIAQVRVMTDHLAGDLEVILHLIAVCVAQISRLLPRAVKGASTKLLPDDKNFLESFNTLRDHFEHLDNRLPGAPFADWIVTEAEVEGEIGFDIGFTSDDHGRILLDGKAIDMTTRGLNQVDQICDATYERMKDQLLADAKEFFEKYPDRIPERVDVPPLTYVSR